MRWDGRLRLLFVTSGCLCRVGWGWEGRVICAWGAGLVSGVGLLGVWSAGFEAVSLSLVLDLCLLIFI